MPDLEDVSVEELRDALESVETKTPALRLMAAIAYKNGVTQTELSDWFGVERKTIYNWLRRISRGTDLVAVVTDESRPGRPRKLSEDAQSRLRVDLQEPPHSLGYDADDWTASVLQEHLSTVYGVDYSLPSCRRLLNEFGP